MKKHICLIIGTLCCALAAAPALAFPTASVTSQQFIVTTYAPEPNGAQRVPTLTVSVKLQLTNPDATPSYINVNDQLSVAPWVNGPPMGVSNSTTPLFTLNPGFSGPTTFNFDNPAVSNGAFYTSTVTVNGVKTQPPYPIGAGPTPLTTDTQSQTVTWT